MENVAKKLDLADFIEVMRNPDNIPPNSTLADASDEVLEHIYERIALAKDNGDLDYEDEPYVTEQDALDALGEYHCMTQSQFIEHYRDEYPEIADYDDMLDIVDFIVETPFLAYVALVDDDLSVLFID